MTNADKFKGIFGIYATELWAKEEKEFLEWLNSDFTKIEENGSYKKIYLTDEQRDSLVMDYGYQVSYDDGGCFITSI